MKISTCYNARKNIFACLFSIHNAISLHVMSKYVYVGYDSGDPSTIFGQRNHKNCHHNHVNINIWTCQFENLELLL